MEPGDVIKFVKLPRPGSSETNLPGRPDQQAADAGRPDFSWVDFNAAPVFTEDKSDAEAKACHWAGLLTGNPRLSSGSLEFAREHVLEWFSRSRTEVFEQLANLPYCLQTTRFWSALKRLESAWNLLSAAAEELRSGALPFCETMKRVEQIFGEDQKRLLDWKLGLENLAEFARWLPGFIEAREYLAAAFPLGRENVDRLRRSLLQSLDDPAFLLNPKGRGEFDARFLEFKKNYIDSYFLLHEDALHVTAGVKVDSAALRSLDLLSGLHYADKGYLDRVKLLAKWIQHHQCKLPLNQILEIYPRCYCNFNPCSRQQPVDSAAQINALIREGLDYFRGILCRCAHLILPELKVLPADDESVKQIKAALSGEPWIPLSGQTIKLLNRIIAKNSSEFLAEVRRSGKKL